jgi:hypothetical protein
MALMDLVAGDVREVLLALAVDDRAGLADPARFDAFLDLGAGLDPTWLDEFSRAARDATGGDVPIDFLDAREEIPDTPTERTIERVTPEWTAAVAALPDAAIARIASRWIDRLEAEGDEIAAGDRETMYQLVRDLVAFSRAAIESEDAETIFAWSL